MAQLAFEQFFLNNLIFNNTILGKHNIDVKLPTVKNMMEIHGSNSSDTVQASFIHLSIQEFLAAVHVCITWKVEDVKKVATEDPNSRRLDNVQLYMAGILGDIGTGDIKIGQKFLQALDERSGTWNNFIRIRQWNMSLE